MRLRGSYRPALFVSAASLSIVLLVALARWQFIYSQDQDRQLLVTNFLAAWLPFGLSILVAFVPDMKKAHIGWRVLVIAGGLFYSVILFRQQFLQIQANHRDQSELVMQAIEKANEHTDMQVGRIRDDLKGVEKRSGDKTASATDSIISLFSKVESHLNESIGKVGKPDPKPSPVLEFTLWNEDPNGPNPLLASFIQPDSDGSVPVSFTWFNKSTTAARSVDLWVDVCDVCSFAKEPSGFDRPTGMREQTRHMFMALLNPRASMSKQTINVKPRKGLTNFEIQLRYSCEECQATGGQKATVFMSPKLTLQ